MVCATSAPPTSAVGACARHAGGSRAAPGTLGQGPLGAQDREDLVCGHHLLAPPRVAGIERHLLDEPQLVAVVEGEAQQRRLYAAGVLWGSVAALGVSLVYATVVLTQSVHAEQRVETFMLMVVPYILLAARFRIEARDYRAAQQLVDQALQKRRLGSKVSSAATDCRRSSDELPALGPRHRV